MTTRVARHQQVPISLSTTGELLDMYLWAGAKTIEISSAETDAASVVYLETGATADGGSVPSKARAIPCSTLPVEIDVYGQGDGLKLYGSGAIDVVVVVR